MADTFYVVFDGPPNHDAPRFVEVEDANGRSLSAGEWKQREDGYWTLGPFQRPVVLPDCPNCGDPLNCVICGERYEG